MPAESQIATRSSEPAARPPRPRGRWFRRIPFIIGLLSLTVWLLPSIIATTPLRNVVVNMAQSQLPKGVTVGSARLSWTEPVQLNDVRVEDQQGREVLHVERIESEETLWQLARQRMNKGLFHFFRPRLTLVVRERSTAIDPAVLRTLQKQQQSLASGSGRRGISFDLANGELVLVDKDGNLLSELTDIEINFHNPADPEEGGRLHVTGRVSQPETGGTITIEADWSGRTPMTSSGHVEARLVKVPVDAVNPRIRSRVDDRRLSGDVTCVLTAEWQPAGDEQVDASLNLDAEEIRLLLSSTAEVAEPSKFELRDSILQCAARLEGTDVHFEELTLQSQPLSGSVTGVVSRRDGELLVDLDGELSSDPDLILDFMPESSRRYVAIEGLTASRIEVTGPIPLTARSRPPEGEDAESSQRATLGQADVGWNSLMIAGVRSDNGRLQAMWQDGRVVLAPQSMTLGGGRVLSLPWVDLSAHPRTLVLDPGPIVDGVQFTPDMTRTWLRYASPLMADATSIDGRFSLSSPGARIPLSAAGADEVHGTLQIHNAQVGPGPSAQRMLAVVEQVQALLNGVLPNPFGGRQGAARQWLVLNEQSVQVRIAENRVHHDRIEYLLGDAVLTSSGSVGYDESLDLTIEVPLQERWLGGRLKSLKGETLRIPVTGTLDAPIVDPRPLTELNRRIAGKAADDLLQRLLGQ